jgi:hypothetical protein
MGLSTAAGGTMSNQITQTLLTAHLETTVPIQIADYLSKGGPSEVDYARIRTVYPTEIGSHGDAVQFRDAKWTATIITMLVDGLAALSFCPGGVTAFGLHWETAVPESGDTA